MIYKTIENYKGTAIIDNYGEHSFSELKEQIEKYKNEFEETLKKKSNIVIYSDYNFYSVAVFLALHDLLFTIIPIVKTTEEEYKVKIHELKPDSVIEIIEKGKLEIKNFSYNHRTSAKRSSLILFSSGTTGKPKMMAQNLSKIISLLKVPRNQKSLRFLILLMFDHIGGINTLLNCLVSGSSFVIPKDRNPSTIIKLIEKYKVNVLPTSPTFLNLMLIDNAFHYNKLKSLKLITYGTERMPERLIEKLNKLLPKVKFLQTFGTSETGVLKTVSKSSNSLYFKIIDENQEYKIIENELYIKSKTSVKGYLNHENTSFKKNGWYATGDLVKEDSQGYIKIVGRKNKIINVGGQKVLPYEIENVINSVHGVIDSTVFSETNLIIGNIVCAKVYSLNTNKKELKSRIRKICKNKLEKFKVPVKIVFEEIKISQRGKKNNI